MAAPVKASYMMKTKAAMASTLTPAVGLMATKRSVSSPSLLLLRSTDCLTAQKHTAAAAAAPAPAATATATTTDMDSSGPLLTRCRLTTRSGMNRLQLANPTPAIFITTHPISEEDESAADTLPTRWNESEAPLPTRVAVATMQQQQHSLLLMEPTDSGLVMEHASRLVAPAPSTIL